MQDLLKQAAQALPENLRPIVEHTFLSPDPAPQERTAALLHLSFSTYRRRRDRAVLEMTEWLWNQELR